MAALVIDLLHRPARADLLEYRLAVLARCAVSPDWDFVPPRPAIDRLHLG